MLAALEGPSVRVVGEAASPVGAGTDPLLSEADVILVAGEELLEEMAPTLSEDAVQALLLISEEDQAVSKLGTLRLGGWGIVLPHASSEELAAAISAVAQGLIVLPKPLSGLLLQEPAVEEPLESLSAREGEVLALLGRGLSNKLIARELHISEHTVKFHVSSLYAKLGVTNRAEAVSQGARRGLISL
jgi:DNA-binding NarL/FixJ family response regulator